MEAKTRRHTQTHRTDYSTWTTSVKVGKECNWNLEQTSRSEI